MHKTSSMYKLNCFKTASIRGFLLFLILFSAKPGACQKSPPRPLAPLQLKVIGIIGDSTTPSAVIEHDSEVNTYVKGDEKPDCFKVLEIGPTWVLVYSQREQIRRRFNLKEKFSSLVKESDYSLQLKGIIKAPEGRMALVSSGSEKFYLGLGEFIPNVGKITEITSEYISVDGVSDKRRNRFYIGDLLFTKTSDKPKVQYPVSPKSPDAIFPEIAFEQGKDPITLGVNRFCLGLFRQMTQNRSGSLFYSPFSIHTALTMCALGAAGTTAREMQKTLHLDSLEPEILGKYQKCLTALPMKDAKGEPIFQSMQSIWCQTGVVFGKEFVHELRNYFSSEIRTEDFVKDPLLAMKNINLWVNNATSNLIPKLLEPKDLDEFTRIVLVSAVFLKARWEHEFLPQNTKAAPFHISLDKSSSVSLMEVTKKFRYFENDKYQVIELPYSSGKLAMIAVLPRSIIGLRALSAFIEPEHILYFLKKGFEEKMVQVFLPKFYLDNRMKVRHELEKMGMKEAFSLAANFQRALETETRAFGQLKVDEVIHQAKIIVDEKGTEAAAATAIPVTDLGPPPSSPPVKFRADHPFLFFIVDRESGLILFMGRFSGLNS